MRHAVRRRRRCAASSPAWSTARTSWSARRAASWTTSSAAAWTSTRSTRWCSTRPIACSTWASSTTSPRSRGSARRSARRCCSRPPTPKASPSSAAQFMREPAADHGARRSTTARKIRQRWYEVKDSERLHAVGLLLNHFRPAQHARLLQHQAAVPRPGARCCRRRASARWRCTATWSSASATRCWCSSPTAAARCWWPPTWPRAASTSPSSKR